MTMGKEDEIQERKSLEGNSRRSMSLEKIEAFSVEGVGEKTEAIEMDQNSGMADKDSRIFSIPGKRGTSRRIRSPRFYI